jgi:hypothetical protein
MIHHPSMESKLSLINEKRHFIGTEDLARISEHQEFINFLFAKYSTMVIQPNLPNSSHINNSCDLLHACVFNEQRSLGGYNWCKPTF